jgi:hypothetical protein
MSYRFNDGYINPGPDGYIRISSDGYSLLTSDGYNIAFFSQTGKVFDAAQGVMYITNRTTAPSSQPSGGGWLYSEQGDGYWYNASGSIQSVSTTRIVRQLTADANYTAVQQDYQASIMEFTSSLSLTGTRNIVVPINNAVYRWIVFNNTTGGQSLQFIGLTGTGVTVANGKRAIIYTDLTNVQRVTPDT